MQRLNRKLDSRGRILLPSSFRKKLNIINNEELTLTLEDESIILKPAQNKCVFCGKPAKYTFINGNLCTECVVTIKQRL